MTTLTCPPACLIDFAPRLMCCPLVRCKVCHGTCFSPQRVAEQLRRLIRDARLYAADTEPDDDACGERRIEAERTYLELAHEQLANELDGTCTACWLMRTDHDKTCIN